MDFEPICYFRRAKLTDGLVVQDVEYQFFNHWKTEQLGELLSESAPTVVLPAAWRLAVNNVISKGNEVEREIYYFFGIFAGVNRISISETFINTVNESMVHDRRNKVIFAEKANLRTLEFEVKKNGIVFEGTFPTLFGTPESKNGHLEKRIGDKVTWTTSIPKAGTVGSRRGIVNPNPLSGSVIVSTTSVVALVLFRHGIYAYEFDERSGDPTNVYVFEFNCILKEKGK